MTEETSTKALAEAINRLAAAIEKFSLLGGGVHIYHHQAQPTALQHPPYNPLTTPSYYLYHPPIDTTSGVD